MKDNGLKILIVDDDEDDITIVKEYIEEGMPSLVSRIDTASSFSEALTLMDFSNYDVCIFDYILGAADGFDLITSVRKKGIDAPIIFLTGKGDEDVAVKAMKSGAVDYLVKSKLTAELITHSIHYAIEIHKNEINRKRMEKQIMQSLEEKELLIKEVHHRVKNNFAVIHSFIELQSDSMGDDRCKNILDDSCNRIHTMALMHEKLYNSKDLTNIDFSSYINNIALDMFKCYRIDSDKITLEIEVKDVPINIKFAMPLGLILNELLSNTIKYAFPNDNKGKVCIYIHHIKNGDIELVFSDNGIGIPDNIDLANMKTLGMKLIFGIVKNQLKGDIEYKRLNQDLIVEGNSNNTDPVENKGSEFIIKFKP